MTGLPRLLNRPPTRKKPDKPEKPDKPDKPGKPPKPGDSITSPRATSKLAIYESEVKAKPLTIPKGRK